MVSGKRGASLHASPMDNSMNTLAWAMWVINAGIEGSHCLLRGGICPDSQKKLGTTDLDYGKIFFWDSCQCFHHSTRKKLGCQMNWGWNLFLSISLGSVAHKCNRWSFESFEVYRKTTLHFDEVWISSFSRHLLLPPSFNSPHKTKTDAHVCFCIAV